MERFISVLGLFAMLAIAWGFSENRRRMNPRIILGGIGLQLILALFVLKTSSGQRIFNWAKDLVGHIISLSDQGATFVFGDLEPHFFAFKVLPTIIFVSSLASLLFHWGILQRIIKGLAWIMYKVMGISGSESLVAAANIFIGQTEAPLLVRPYITSMTRSEINLMMCSGMATVAGGVLAAFVGMGISAGHLLAASIMSAPAAVVIAKIMVPETENSPTLGTVSLTIPIESVNAFDAACRGAADGLKLALNVAAMIIAFIAIVALADLILLEVTSWLGYSLSFKDLMGFLFFPFAFLMGVPWEDCFRVGQLLGEKMTINELIAYQHLGEMISQNAISERAATISTYALCGFANFSSIAIQIGGIGNLEPSRKQDFAKLGFKAMVGGTLAAFMTACIAGFLT